MQSTQTQYLRLGLGLVAMVAVLAVVLVLATFGTSGGTKSVSASVATPTPGGLGDNFTILAKASNPVGTDPVTIDITKETGQKIVLDDKVLYNGQRWIVTGRTYTLPTPTLEPTPDLPSQSAGAGTAELTLQPPGPCDNPASWPQDDKWVYEWPPLPKPCNDGNVSGIYDMEVIFGGSIYHCVARIDHDAKTDLIKSNTQCYSDIEIGDPVNILSGVNAYDLYQLPTPVGPPGGPEGPDNGGAGNEGPPVPPPYTNLQPFKGEGSYDPIGDELTFVACVARTGAGALGPNLLIRVNLPGVKASDVLNGTAELYPGKSNAECDSLAAPTGGGPLDLRATKATAATPVAWRTSATDLDGDGCSDSDELAKPDAIPKGCGDDPYNPGDSNESNFTGSYSISVEIVRAGGTTLDPDADTPGSYFSCLADIQQTGNGKTDGDLVARAFCYTDGSLPVNNLGYPGVQGDGFPGGGPAWGAIPQEGALPETDCTRFIAADEDGDTVVNDGCPADGLGDTDSKQTELTGYVDNADNTLKLRGCFEDEDASSALINVYVELTVNKNTGVGTVDIWSGQNLADCAPVTPHPFGTYITIGGPHTGPPNNPVPFGGAQTTIVRQPGDKTRDSDQDGIPNAAELRDDGANCGLRDPFNPYDWYDVNAQDLDPDPNVEDLVAAPDGVIDLANDILGVIQHYSPAGADPYDEIWDRGKPITGGAGNWSREAPDGVIDLANDILGVIQQYHPGAC